MITVKSYPDNILDLEIDVDPTNDSNEIISNLWINVSEALPDTSIEITYNDDVITLLIEEECKNTPVDIAFINKDGQLQLMTFFKKRTDKMSITKEGYERNELRQFRKFNVQAKSSFTLNSGYVDEVMNDVFKQMLLSELVWIYNGVEFIPVNITTSNIDYKTRQNDKLISYAIDFEFAFNEVKNI